MSRSHAVRELGIPVRSVNWVRLFAGQCRTGRPCLYATMGQEADSLFVLQIDPRDGSCRQFGAPVAGANYPTAALMSRTGRLYVGGAYAGHLFCFDPREETLLDLGAIHPDAATFPCRIDEDGDGVLWIGSYGTADLTSFDPSTCLFTHHGRMDEVDMYNYPLVNVDGCIANLIRVTRSLVVVLDPRTGEKTQVGPVAIQGEDTLDLFRGGDGALYIESTLGDFRLEGTRALPVDELPARQPEPLLPDGSTFAFCDAEEQVNRVLEVKSPSGDARRFTLDYQAGGSSLFAVHAGPDGCVYGSSVMPLHLFRYRPEDGELADLGQCSSATGEAYSMANLDGEMYIASYPRAVLSVYDPTRPYRFGDDPQANPRDLGRMDELSYRPRTTLTGPRGRVWTASIPDYGRWGGPLSWYDPRSGQRGVHHGLASEGSCYTLAWLREQGLMAVGTTVSGGSGTEPRIDQASLVLWDYERETVVWEGSPERPVTAFNSLLTGPDGRLLGTIVGGESPALFIFDPESRVFLHLLPLPDGRPLDLGLQAGPDQAAYGFTDCCLYRLDHHTLEIDVLIRQVDGFSIPGPVVGRDVYYARRHQLMAARIL